jgi:hypothetical protein
MIKSRYFFTAMLALIGVVLAQAYTSNAYATADSLVRNTGGFFAKRASDGKYYPAVLCYSTDGSQALVQCREGGTGIAPGRLDASSTHVNNDAYVTAVASTAAASTSISVYNGTSSDLVLALGASSSEVDKLALAPSGWSGPYKLFIPSGTRISLKSKSADASAGVVLVNLMQ